MYASDTQMKADCYRKGFQETPEALAALLDDMLG